jgi:hypothetical protein
MPVDQPVLEPPAEFVRRPDKVIIETVMSAADVQAECVARVAVTGQAGRFVGRVFLGCSQIVGTYCVVIRQDDERLRVHELAHCNGWAGDHPGGVWRYSWGSTLIPGPIPGFER